MSAAAAGAGCDALSTSVVAETATRPELTPAKLVGHETQRVKVSAVGPAENDAVGHAHLVPFEAPFENRAHIMRDLLQTGFEGVAHGVASSA